MNDFFFHFNQIIEKDSLVEKALFQCKSGNKKLILYGCGSVCKCCCEYLEKWGG